MPIRFGGHVIVSRIRANRWLCPPYEFLRTHRFDIVAVGIDQERGEIARAVIGPRAGRTVVAAAGFQPGGVKFLDRGVVGRAERDGGAGAAWSLVQVEPQRRGILGPEPGAVAL